MSSARRFRLGALAALAVPILAIAPTAAVPAAGASTDADVAQATAYLEASNTYARGSFDFTWGVETLTAGTYHIKDFECNGVPVYVKSEAEFTDGTKAKSAARWQLNGCGADYAKYEVPATTWHKPIAYMRVFVCEQGGVHCAGGAWKNNPYT